jgi:hypothetical protein
MPIEPPDEHLVDSYSPPEGEPTTRLILKFS